MVYPAMTGAPWLPFFVPNKMSIYTDRMIFLDRLQNTALTVMASAVNLMPDLSEDMLDAYFERYGTVSFIG